MPDVTKEKDWGVTPLYQALEVARVFGQEPIGYARVFEKLSRGMRAQLVAFVRLRADLDSR